MRGGKRKGAGRPKLDPATRWLCGSWRPSRHGPRPATLGALAVQPAPGQSWAPSAADLAHLGAAGRALVADLLGRYDLGAVEGRVLLETGRAADVLATLRTAADPATLRVEQVWSRHYAVLLNQLHVERS